MNKGNYIGTIFIIALLGGLVAFLMSRNRTYDWDINLRENLEEPYDINLFVNVLASSYGEDFQQIYKRTEFETATDSGKGTIIYVDDVIKLSDDHIDKLEGFIKRGNTVIFSSNIIPENLIEKLTEVDFDIDYYSEIKKDERKPNFLLGLTAQEESVKKPRYDKDGFYIDDNDHVTEEADYQYDENGDSYEYKEPEEEDTIVYEYPEDEEEETYDLYLTDSIASVSFMDNPAQDYKFKFIQKDTASTYNWSGICKPLFDDYNTEGDFIPISMLNDSLYDVISMNYGEGKLLVHMNPILFSNIYFKEKSGFDYVNQLTKHFSEGKVYFNRKYNYVSNSPIMDSSDAERQKAEIESPLSFVLGNPGLKWALYSIFILSLLYLVFAFKRRLPVIPLYEKPKNTSISFVKALSSFYLGAKDHAVICNEMMVNFKHFLRKRYGLNTHQDKEELIPLISKISGIHIEKVKQIFHQELKINYSNESKSKRSIELYKALESFYANCK